MYGIYTQSLIIFLIQREDLSLRSKKCPICEDRHASYIKVSAGKRKRGVNEDLRTEHLEYNAYFKARQIVEDQIMEDVKFGNWFFKSPEAKADMILVRFESI